MTPPAGPSNVTMPAVHADRALALDLTVARLLGAGTLFSVALLALGVILMAVTGQSPLDAHFPTLDIGRLPADLLALRPAGLLWLGLGAVILTPISRVVASLVGYARVADRSMVIISLAILGVIAASVVVSMAAS
jgi:uncharacterized membrane protein